MRGVWPAVVERATHVRSSVVASQIDRHARYGGVVPELASRHHLERIDAVIDMAIRRAGVALDDLDAVAVTSAPRAFQNGSSLVQRLFADCRTVEAEYYRRTKIFPIMHMVVMRRALYEELQKIMVEEAYDRVGFTTTLALKDANLILEAGALAGVPLPSGELYRERLQRAIAAGDGERDWAVLALEQARASGLE